MIEINLIPDVKRELLKAQRTRATVITVAIITSIAAVGVVALLAAYVYGVQTVRDGLAQRDIDTYSKELTSVEDLSEILTIQNQLSRINDLNANKKISSRVFDMLNAVIPPAPNSVQVSSLAVDTEEGTIQIQGQTGSFESLEVLKKTLDNAILVYQLEGENQETKLASSINTKDLSYGETDGAKVLRFTLSYTYAPELMDTKIAGLTFKLKINGNVTDSYLGIPKSIFTERASDIEEGQ